jgi:chromosome segregation ATPase
VNLITFLRNRESTRRDEQQTAWSRYRGLLERFASGDEVDSSQADLILDAAGKSEADLQSDVALLERRITWRKQLDDGATAEADASQADAAIERAQQAIEKAIAKYQPAIDAALAIKQASEHRRTIARYAEQSLAGELRDTGLADRIKNLNRELRGLQAERRGLEERAAALNAPYWARKIESHQTAMKSLSTLDNTSRAHHTKRCQEARARLEEASEKARRFESELGTIQQAIESIEAELADCRERMLMP